MYVIALKDQLSSGLYAVENDYNEKVLYFFIDEDDANRYVGLLEADNFPELEVIEVDDEISIEACRRYGYPYLIITPEDLMIPPSYHDNL
jgi:hypothetical protein